MSGTCAQCGAPLAGEPSGSGLPRYCSTSCSAAAFGDDPHQPTIPPFGKLPRSKRVRCPICKRRVAKSGLAAHHAAKHSATEAHDGQA